MQIQVPECAVMHGAFSLATWNAILKNKYYKLRLAAFCSNSGIVEIVESGPTFPATCKSQCNILLLQTGDVIRCNIPCNLQCKALRCKKKLHRTIRALQACKVKHIRPYSG